MSRIPKLLDLFACAGGASMGYHMAGFEVTGVDIERHDAYPFEFHQGDAIVFVKEHGHEFDAIAASPPCQAYSVTKSLHTSTHAQLVEPTRDALAGSGKPYVIENVVGAPLRDPIQLCGSMFGLRVRRHRLFESNVPLEQPPCDHAWQDADLVYNLRVSKSRGRTRRSGIIPVHGGLQMLFDDKSNTMLETHAVGAAMGIDWMTKAEMNQAIPPAYTRHIGAQLMQYLS